MSGDLIRMADVPALVRELSGIDRTRQTVYLWATRGVNGTRLQTELHAGQVFTTRDWVRTFLATIDRR